MSSEEKIEIKETDMENAQKDIVIGVVRESQRLYNIDKDVAAFVKEKLDKKFGGTWHVICGKCFGSRVSYEMGHFILLKCNKMTPRKETPIATRQAVINMRENGMRGTEIAMVNVMIYKCGY